MTAPPCVVIDTNVWAVAERMHGGANDSCIAACLDLLKRLDENSVTLVVDDGDRILMEYVATLRSAQTAGLAVKLARRLWQTRWSRATCKKVAVTQLDEPAGCYGELPADLHDFDVDDQKFLAVAIADGGTPPVFQALDREWWDRRADLNAAGLDVQFLCAIDLLRDA